MTSAGGWPARRQLLARLARWTAVITSFSMVLVLAGVVVYAKLLDQRLTKVPLDKPVPGQPTRPPDAPGKALNILLVGSDTREGASAEDLREFGTEFEGGRRSDTIILLHLSSDRSRSVFVSFPRDAFVEIPGHGRGKINSAYGKGETVADGVRTLRATLENLTGLRIDHYIGVDFRGFLKMVNALDGVPVCLTEPAVDPKAGLDLPAGRQTVRGRQALAFVRTRSIDGRVDFGRIERQQRFLAATLNKATSLGMLADPPKLHRFLTSAADALTIDDRLDLGTMTDLALNLRGLDARRVTFLTAPVADPSHRVDGQLTVLLDATAGAALWDALRRDVAPPGAVPSATPSDGSAQAPAPGARPSPTVAPRRGIAPAPFEQRTAADDLCA